MPPNLSALIDGGAADARWALCDLASRPPRRLRTLADLQTGADRFAWTLAARGMRPGDTVALAAANSAAFLECLLGALKVGCVVAPLNPRAGADMLAYMLQDSDAKLVVCDGFAANRMPSEAPPMLRLDTEEVLKSQTGGAYPAHQPGGDDLGVILYTSGSTGRPKGVMHTHRGLDAMLAGTGTLRNPLYRGRSIVAAPLFHMNGLLYTLLFLACGGSVVLLPQFEASAYAEAIETYRVTSVTGVPPMIAMLATDEDASRRDLGSVTTVTLGSGPLSAAIADQATRLFPNARVSNIYGVTELGAPFGPHPGGIPTPVTSVGFPASHCEMRLADGATAEEGVLEVRAVYAMAGYRNLPKLTDQRLRDGWYRTGDLFRRDAEGFFHFIGREDDMFVCGGENIYPAEVERVIEAVPGVANACVVGIADERRGHIPVAFVTAQPGAVVTEEVVKAFTLAAAAQYLHPRRVFVVDALPVSAVNKFDRRLLLEDAIRRIASSQ